MKKLKWGILSTGRMSDWFCGDFHQVGNGDLFAVASRSIDAASAFARKYDIPHAYGDYEEMLANPDIDVIYISTPHTLHFQNTVDALRAGKHVLCEKPITTNADEAEQLTKVARECGCYLMEAMWSYFLPSMRKAKEWVSQGRIGEITHIQNDFGYPVPYAPDLREYDPKFAGGCLLEMGVYPVAITRYFAEQDPTSIYATGRFAPNGVEEDVTAVLNYPDMTATIGVSFLSRLRNAAQIIGTEGWIVIPNAFRSHECFLYVVDDCIDRFSAPRETRGYEYQAIAFNQNILDGKLESETVPHSASIAFQKQIDAIKAEINTTT